MPTIPDGVYSITKPGDNGATVILPRVILPPQNEIVLLPLTFGPESKVSRLLILSRLCHWISPCFISGMSKTSATETLPFRALEAGIILDFSESLRWTNSVNRQATLSSGASNRPRRKGNTSELVNYRYSRLCNGQFQCRRSLVRTTRPRLRRFATQSLPTLGTFFQFQDTI